MDSKTYPIVHPVAAGVVWEGEPTPAEAYTCKLATRDH